MLSSEFMEIVSDLRAKEKAADEADKEAVACIKEYCEKTYSKVADEKRELLGFVNGIIDLLAVVNTNMPVDERPSKSIQGRRGLSRMIYSDRDPENSWLEFSSLAFKCDFTHARLVDVSLRVRVERGELCTDPVESGLLDLGRDDGDVDYWMRAFKSVESWAHDMESMVCRLKDGLLALRNDISSRSSRSRDVVDRIKGRTARVQNPDMPAEPAPESASELLMEGIASARDLARHLDDRGRFEWLHEDVAGAGIAVPRFNIAPADTSAAAASRTLSHASAMRRLEDEADRMRQQQYMRLCEAASPFTFETSLGRLASGSASVAADSCASCAESSASEEDAYATRPPDSPETGCDPCGGSCGGGS